MEKYSAFSEEDRRTFIAVQVERYLKRKTSHRFCSDAERDVILQIIDDCWEDLEHKAQLGQMDTDHKITAYYKVIVVFPYFVAEEENLINVDFRKKKRISGDDLCPCGSGRTFRHCCGRVSSLESLLNVSY